MKKVIKLEDYREKKTEKAIQTDHSLFREEPKEKFSKMLDKSEDIKFHSDDYDIYDDEFIQENAKYIIYHTLPFCTVCDSPLQQGDRIDSMWPLEYGHNICKRCEDKMPDKIKKEKVMNLDKLELVLAKEDFKKIKEHLSKKDLYNINGHQIVVEKVYQKIKYQILND